MTVCDRKRKKNNSECQVLQIATIMEFNFFSVDSALIKEKGTLENEFTTER